MALTKDDIQAIEQLLESIAQEIRDIQLTLENQTNHNIRLIAEGGPDLSKKLDEVLKIDNEKELLLIRVNSLENELQKVKERINNIA